MVLIIYDRAAKAVTEHSRAPAQSIFEYENDLQGVMSFLSMRELCDMIDALRAADGRGGRVTHLAIDRDLVRYRFEDALSDSATSSKGDTNKMRLRYIYAKGSTAADMHHRAEQTLAKMGACRLIFASEADLAQLDLVEVDLEEVDRKEYERLKDKFGD